MIAKQEAATGAVNAIAEQAVARMRDFESKLAVADKKLHERDRFIVDKRLWDEFAATAPS